MEQSVQPIDIFLVVQNYTQAKDHSKWSLYPLWFIKIYMVSIGTTIFYLAIERIILEKGKEKWEWLWMSVISLENLFQMLLKLKL